MAGKLVLMFMKMLEKRERSLPNPPEFSAFFRVSCASELSIKILNISAMYL